jgi:hypothetical protein
MALTDYKKQFDNAYQEVFQKALVAKVIMNTRFEPVLKYGASIERVKFDISNVQVRTVTRGAASTIDTISDSGEFLTVNVEKEAVFYISDGEATQTGPLNPGEEIGKQVGIKVAVDLDARCFFEVTNASQTFDNGDLTTLKSSGTPITLTITTVPQMVTRWPAKIRKNNFVEVMTNMCVVVDSYAASDIAQFLISKNIDLAGYVFKNGYSGDLTNAQMYISENLTGQANLALSVAPTDGDTVVIGGTVFTFNTTLSTNPGSVLISGSAASSNTNLAALINTPGTTTTYGTALSTADQLNLTQTLKLAATASSAAVKIVGTGSGRMVLAGTLTNTNNTWSVNFIHAYAGKKGAIDLVVQDMAPVDMRITTDRRGTNVFSSYLAGIKTFSDGAKKFLDMWIAA